MSYMPVYITFHHHQCTLVFITGGPQSSLR